MIARKFASNCNVCSFLRFCGTVRMIFRKQHCLCLSNGSAGRSHWPRQSRHLMKWSCMFLTVTQYIIRVWIGWLGGCLLVLVRVEVVYCVRLSPFHMFYGGIVFVCLPAALATFLKQDVQNWSLFLCVKSVILNGKGLVVSLAGRLPLLSYQEVCTDSWSPEVILLMLFRWYLVDLWCVDTLV